MESVLIFGNYRPSVTVVRSLGRAGYRLVVGISEDPSFAERSRFCDETWLHPPSTDPDRCFDALREFLGRRSDVSLLFPVDQASVLLTARRRAELPPTVTPIVTDLKVIEACLSKTRMFARAEAAGVPVEPYAAVATIADLERAAQQIGLPCIVRPVGSGPERFSDGRKAVVVRTPQELRDEFGAWPSEHTDLLVQRYSPGPRHGVYFAAREGRILARLEVVSERTDRIDGTGFAVEGITAPADPTLVRYVDSLVASLRYTGIGCLQFLRRPDASFHFLELNPRLGGNSAIAVYCGLDMPLLACDLATGRCDYESRTVPSFPVGKRYAWTFGELQGIRRARVRRDISRLDTIVRLVRALHAAVIADVHLTWSLNDPVPTLATYAYWAPAGLGRRLLPSTIDDYRRSARSRGAPPASEDRLGIL